VGYTHTFNRLTAELGYDRYDTTYDNNVKLDGEILYNGDRDRTRDALLLSLQYALSSGVRSVFFSAATNNVDYDQKVNQDGDNRSSDGYSVAGGVAFKLTGLLEGDLYLRYLDQSYDDPSFNNVSGVGIGGGLLWTPTEVTNVSFKFTNTPQETTQTGSSGYYSQLYAVRVQHELRRNLLANIRFFYTDNNYQNNGDGDSILNNTGVYSIGLGLSYLVNRHINISGGYVYGKQTANSTLFDYTTNRLFVIVGFEL
jgi:hypothetical protein